MKLNPDCVRDLLLVIEDTCDSNNSFDYYSNQENKILSKYTPNELYYHFRQADLSGLLHQPNYDMSKNFYTMDLSPNGHEFLSNIRQDNNWNKTKGIAKEVGSFSLDALKSISTGVVTNLINQHLTP